MLTYTQFLNARAAACHDSMMHCHMGSSDLERYLAAYSNYMREKCMYQKIRRSQRSKNQSMLWMEYLAKRKR